MNATIKRCCETHLNSVSLGLAVFVWSTPGATAALLGVLMGVEMLVNGFGLIFMAFFVKEAGTRA